MTNTSENVTLASDAGVLTALRALAVGSSGSIADALDVANSQAGLLQDLLPGPTSRTPIDLADLIPSIIVEHVDGIPVPGISFWAGGHWHIHICASDPADTRDFTVLHELKHIIDHPLRRRASEFSSVDWETLANHFAAQVLTRTPRPIVMSGERRDTNE
jgi:hypothetical protein